jgi:hypothetical protein
MSVPLPWDVRTTDLWVHHIDGAGNIIKSWNILQGEIPEIPSAASEGVANNVRIDIRLKNFSASYSVTVRAVCQTIGISSGNAGALIYTPSTALAPNQEAVHAFILPMWEEDVYERLWVHNTAGVGNCPAGQPPPWTGCYQGELFDFALSSRHLVRINKATVGPVATALTITPLTSTTVSPGQSIDFLARLTEQATGAGISGKYLYVYMENSMVSPVPWQVDVWGPTQSDGTVYATLNPHATEVPPGTYSLYAKYLGD